MREEQKHDELIDRGAASALTLGDEVSTFDESVDLPDRWF